MDRRLVDGLYHRLKRSEEERKAKVRRTCVAIAEISSIYRAGRYAIGAKYAYTHDNDCDFLVSFEQLEETRPTLQVMLFNLFNY